MVFTLPIWVTPHAVGLSCGYAIWQGDIEERVFAWGETALLAVAILLFNQRHAEVAWNALYFLVELGLAAAVMFRSDKAWPLAYCATALVGLMTVLAQLVAPVSLWAYGTAVFVWTYLECVILVLGTWRAVVDRNAAIRTAVTNPAVIFAQPKGVHLP